MMSNLERLVYMANQIARNFEALGHEAAFKATADHIASFWDPRMKAQIFAYLADGGSGLSPTGRAAIELLRDKGDPASQTRATEFNAVGESGHADAG
jgi:formate dehydrogenase subunit delta